MKHTMTDGSDGQVIGTEMSGQFHHCFVDRQIFSRSTTGDHQSGILSLVLDCIVKGIVQREVMTTFLRVRLVTMCTIEREEDRG